jgi:hypothetical protein
MDEAQDLSLRSDNNCHNIDNNRSEAQLEDKNNSNTNNSEDKNCGSKLEIVSNDCEPEKQS